MKSIIVGSLILLGVAIGGTSLRGRNVHRNLDSGSLSATEAIQIMRAVNTAEAETLALSKHVVNMSAVRGHRFVKELDPTIGLINPASSDSTLVKGYEVRLLIDQDQQHYTLTIHPLEPPTDCAPVYLTNETGVIYQGAPANCQQ